MQRRGTRRSLRANAPIRLDSIDLDPSRSRSVERQPVASFAGIIRKRSGRCPLRKRAFIVDSSSRTSDGRRVFAAGRTEKRDTESHGGVGSNLLPSAPAAAARSSRATVRRARRFGFFALNRPFRDPRARPSRNLRCFACRRRSQHVRDEPGEGFLRRDTEKRESTSRSASRRRIPRPSHIGYSATYIRITFRLSSSLDTHYSFLSPFLSKSCDYTQFSLSFSWMIRNLERMHAF